MADASPADHGSAPGERRDRASLLVWLGVIGIITIAVVRALVMFSPQLHFDIDPALSPQRFAGLGIAGSLLLDALAMLCAGVTLAGLALEGLRVRWWLVVCVLVGGVVAYVHGLSDAGDARDLWRGSTWFAAMLCGVAIAHLPAGDPLRRVVIIILLASLAPMMLRGGLQLTLEHQDTLAQFEASKEQFFRDRGWAPDSPMAQIYERRLRQPNPRGWFETTNILASLMIVALATFGGALLGSIRSKLASGWIGLFALLCGLAAVGLWMSGSRGAILVAIICLVLVMVPWFARERMRWLWRLLPWVAAGGCLLAILGVIARGSMLPESFAGELSVLFRWHYWQGALQMLRESPLAGFGPGGFQDAYALHRPVRSPEEVASAHNVFIDWLAALGIIGGVAFLAAMLALLRGLGRRAMPAQELAINTQHAIMALGCVVVIASAVSLAAESPALDPLLAMLRVIGLALMAILGWVMATHTRLLAGTSDDEQSDGGAADVFRWGLCVTVIGMLVHSQIEMTLFQPGSVLWCLCLIGAVSCISRERSSDQQRDGSLLASAAYGAAGLAPAMMIIAMGVLPAWSQQRMIASTAAMVAASAEQPRDAQIAVRRNAAAALVDAYDRWPSNPQPLLDAVDQLRLAGSMADLDLRRQLLDESDALAQRAVADHPSQVRVAAALSLATYQRAAAEQTPENWQDAVDAAARLTEMDPHAIASWRRLGDVLWGAQRQAEAADAYRRALQNNHNLELDPLKQLSEADRALIEQRIGE